MPEPVRQADRPLLPRRGNAVHRPRVLFLACHLPWPPLSGGRRRELELITRLSKRFDIHLVVVSKTPDADVANRPALAPYCQRVEIFPAAAPARAADPPPRSAPGQVQRHRSRAATLRVREIIASNLVDLVHVEGFYLMQHVPHWVETPVLLVEQNIEYELDRQRARSLGGRVTRLDSFFESMRTHRAELECWRRATRLATVTWEDREAIRAELPGAEVTVVPDGVDHLPSPHAPNCPTDDTMTLERPTAPLVMLLANFGYSPNVDAAVHLCRDILPALRAVVPDVQIWLVGNAPPSEVTALAVEGVTVTGYVPEVTPYLDAADVVVCPLRIGGGIKVKTIEALRRGKAIVCTGIGAQGLPAPARDALVVVDDPSQFAGAVAELLRDADRRARLERLAANAAQTKLPTWDESAAALSTIYRELLGRRAPSERRLVARGHLAGRLA